MGGPRICDPRLAVQAIGFGDPGLAVQAIGFCEPGMSVIGFGDPGLAVQVSVIDHLQCESGLVICNPGILATCGELVSVSFSQSGLVI